MSKATPSSSKNKHFISYKFCIFTITRTLLFIEFESFIFYSQTVFNFKKSNNAINVISWISIVAIALTTQP